MRMGVLYKIFYESPEHLENQSALQCLSELSFIHFYLALLAMFLCSVPEIIDNEQ